MSALQVFATLPTNVQAALALLIEGCDEILAAHKGEVADEHSPIGKLRKARATLTKQEAP